MHVRRWEPEEDINTFRVTFNKDMNIFNANSGQTGTVFMNLSGLAHLWKRLLPELAHGHEW